jgi:hypothetical protein
MAIQNNFPSIKPSLLLDFANTKALDPRITFTRASSGRFYDGKTVAKAEENLLLRSQNYSVIWTVTNLTPVTGKTAPDGTSTATEFTATAANAVLTQGFTAVAGDYTFSVFLRRVTGTGDIEIAADNGTWTTKVITSSWARYDVTQTVAAGSKTAGIRVVTDTDAIEVWGAQLEQRSAVTAYTPTTTQPITNYIPVLQAAVNNIARFDHNPVTGESLGLLVEEQRANLFTYSAQFDDAAWTKSNTTITSNAIVAPDGTLAADWLIASADNSQHAIFFPFTTTASPFTFSVYAKPAGQNWLFMRINDSGNTARFAWFNVATGAVGTVQTNLTATITSVGNGFYRCSITVAAALAGSQNVLFGVSNADGVNSYLGDGYSGIYIWGAQLEAGAFATSYIPTVASSVTRAADDASMTGANFSSWYNQAEGTLYAEAAASSFVPTAGVFAIGDPTFTFATRNNTSIVFSPGDSGRIRSNVVVNGVSSISGAPFYTPVVNAVAKAALTYKLNDLAASTNGLTAITSASGTVPVVTTASIGSLTAAWSSAAQSLNGHLKKIAYYPSRLTNANLQALTS